MSSSKSTSDQKLKILLFGSIGSQIEPFCEKLLALQASKAGPFDAAFCVGSCHVLPLIHLLKKKKQEQSTTDKDNTSLPLPVFLQEPLESINTLIDQGHEPEKPTESGGGDSQPTVDDSQEQSQDPDFLLKVYPNLYILRNQSSPHRASVWSLPIGRSINGRKKRELVVAACPSHLRSDSDQVKELMQNLQHVSYRGCDLLLTTEWPQGIETVLKNNSATTMSNQSTLATKANGDDTNSNQNTGQPANISYDIADIALQARARYHVAVASTQTQTFVQSPPYAHLASLTNTVPIHHTGRFLALGSVVDNATLKQRGGGKLTKFVHALGLKPLFQMSMQELQEGGNAVLPCPFTDAVYQMDGSNSSKREPRRANSAGANRSSVGGLSEASARRILAEEQSKRSGSTVAAQRWATNNSRQKNSQEDGNDIDPTNQTLFVHGLHKDVTGLLQSSRGDAVLLRAFQTFQAVQIRKPPNAPTSSFAFVDFPSHAQALACWKDHRSNGITVSGVHLDVKWASNNKRKRGNELNNDNPDMNQKRTRLTEATAKDSSTVYYKLPSEMVSSGGNDRGRISEILRVWMERTLEDALAPADNSGEDGGERITAAEEPALRVQESVPEKHESDSSGAVANFGFLEFASHAAASMALATLTGSTDGGLVLSDAPRLPGKEYKGLRFHWGQGKKAQNEKDIIEDASGFKFERKHFPADARKDCWFCLASDACEKHLITGVYDKCYTAMPKGPVHPGHVLLIPVQHEDRGALKNIPVAEEMEEIKAKLYQHASLAYDMDMFVFERAIQTKGGYHSHVQCIPIPRRLGIKLQATMMTQARKIGINLREISSDLDMSALVNNDDEDQKENSGYFYAEIVNTASFKTSTTSPEIKKFLYKTSQPNTGDPGRQGSSATLVPLQFGREVLAAVMGKPELAHWKACVASQEEETKLAREMRDSIAKYMSGKENKVSS